MDHRADSKGVEIVSSDRIEALSRSLADSTSRRGVLRLVGVGVAGTAVATVGFNSTLAKKHKGGTGLDLPVQGVAGGEVVFTGILTVKKFAAKHGDITALGTLSGTLEKKGKEHNVTRGVRLPVTPVFADGGGVQAQQVGECEVLHLELGPINLNLLGLEVTIEGEGGVPIIIDIDADPSGGLLGQLLCGLAGGGGGPLQQIIGLLNDLLDVLQGL
jgi:hypothetical protein